MDQLRLPTALRASAVPRWSHRDAVEGGNPFPTNDLRHELWNAATHRATEALVRFDADLESRATVTADPSTYRAQLLDLAGGRFDTWARRGLCVVWNAGTLRDYEQWLRDYTDGWLTYVAETCPRVEVSAELRTCLTKRMEYWASEARTFLDHRTNSP